MRMLEKNVRLLLAGAVVALIVGLPTDAVAASGVTTLTVESGEYRIETSEQGQQIEMEGFGRLMAPGKPMLPMKNYLIALPPGAQVRSVGVKGLRPKELPGSYRISPSPQILPVAGPKQIREIVKKLNREWWRNYLETYLSSQAYPSKRGEATGAGSLRKYRYASVAFYPFKYHPISGRLVHYAAARIRIRYDLPSPGSAGALEVEALRHDTVADGRAQELFCNRQDLKAIYGGAAGMPAAAPSVRHDYVILTNPALVSAIEASGFVAWKESLGYRVKIVTTTNSLITGQPGLDIQQKIRNFLRASYGPWGIRYVLIVGKHETLPMRYCYPDPSDHSSNPYYPYAYGGSVPTDHYYADLSDPDAASWDSDGDGYPGEYGEDNPDFLAEVSVGRIPTSNGSRVTYTLDKIVRFEQDTGAWKRRALHGAAILFHDNQDYGGVPFIDGCRTVEAVQNDFMSGWAVDRFSEHDGLVPSSYPWQSLTMSNFSASWRVFAHGVVNWAGHGSADGVYRIIWNSDDGDGVYETDGSDGISAPAFVGLWSVLDDDRPAIVTAVSCLVGYPDQNVLGNLGVDLLTKPGFGAAAAVVAASRPAAITAYWPTVPGGAESICYEFNKYMIGNSERVGDALYHGKFDCHFNSPMSHIYEFQNLFDYNLFGDPSLVREGIE